MAPIVGYLSFLLVSALFSAYTLNLQKTTLAIGKRLSPNNESLPRGFQDAITPPWQTRNNVLMFVSWLLAFFGGFFLWDWYWALCGFVIFAVGLIPVCSTLMPRPCSPHYISLIKGSLQQRLKNYRLIGDEARSEAAAFVVQRLESAYPDLSNPPSDAI